MDKKDFLLYVEQYNPNMDTESIGLAFDFGKEVFQEQYRKSGEPYFIHCIETAKTLVKLRLDKATIIAGLLHDVVEDTPVKLEEIREKFGDEIAFLVDGLTKITDVQRKDITYQQAETFRKMLIAMAKDIRVILVKLADRLHNMRTLEYHSDKDKIRRIAQETLDIYVPIAYRLGMASIKTELEDLCLKFLKPEIYEDIVRKLNQTRNEQNATLEEMKSELNNLLKSFNIKYRLLSRVKHYSSIYRKMTKRGIPLEEMRDLLGTKIITSSIAECYQIIGIVHQHWHTIPDEFYDYIANPKSNNYQSIHTAIRYKNNYPVKLHIETEEMHIRAEAGIAAHWKYESSDFKDKALESYLIWLRRLLEWLPESENSEEFMSNLKLDLYPEEIYVFTPIGEIKQLPLDATPVDFAFAVHTEVGLHCEAAKVDGKKVPLDTTLQSGQTVEIISSKLKTPSTEWLRFVKTGKARSAIHRYQKESNSRLCRIIGEELLYREIRRQKIKIKNLEDELKNITQKLDYTNISDLFIAIGNGYLPLKAIIEHLPETKIGLSLLPLKENLLSLIRKSSKGLSLLSSS